MECSMVLVEATGSRSMIGERKWTLSFQILSHQNSTVDMGQYSTGSLGLEGTKLFKATCHIPVAIKGQPQMSVLTFSLVWDRVSLVYCCVCWTTGPRASDKSPVSTLQLLVGALGLILLCSAFPLGCWRSKLRSLSLCDKCLTPEPYS